VKVEKNYDSIFGPPGFSSDLTEGQKKIFYERIESLFEEAIAKELDKYPKGSDIPGFGLNSLIEG
jgi:hypothetical protein